MKTNVLLAFFFFSAALFAITKAEIVYDSHGDLLKNGGNYYLWAPGLGGNAIQGATIKNSDGSCSLAVVVKLSYKGWLINIASPYLTLNITTDSPLRIRLAQLPLGQKCAKNSQWVVTRVLGFVEPVMVGDANEFPVPLSGWFFIKPYDSAKFHYKLVFCYEHGKCGHVGVKTDSHGSHRLVVTEDEKVEPWALKFVKETSDEAVASDISMVV